MAKNSKRHVKRAAKKTEEKDHYPGFFLKPRNVFIAGVVILLVVIAFGFSQVKTTQTGFAIKAPEKPLLIAENSIRNLQESNTEFGKVCKYELFKNNKWISDQLSSLSCLELAKQNTVV